MRRPIVAGNWKMQGSRTENARLIEELLAHCPAQPAATCVVCPPFVYLQETGRMVRGSVLSLGGQDVCAEAQGAFTGEVSAAMLKDVGCERSEEHTSELQSQSNLVCRLLLEKKKKLGHRARVQHASNLIELLLCRLQLFVLLALLVHLLQIKLGHAGGHVLSLRRLGGELLDL